MGAIFSRLKNWIDEEKVTNEDLNAEFDNILANFDPDKMNDYSTNVAEMRTSTDPGESGSESLATTLAGEVERLRFAISELKGPDQTYWYESPTVSITELNNAVGGGLPPNRVVSGRTRTNSLQPIHLVANGASNSVQLKGATTDFNYYINGVKYTISSDVTLSGLTTAAATQNTCLVNESSSVDQTATKYRGEQEAITVDAMGTNITALIGKFAAFKIENGSDTEYFIAHVDSATSLSKVYRGYFFDSSDAPIPRIVYSNNDTITLMHLTWVFAKSDGTLTATYNNPVWSADEPSAPSVNDYWYDTVNNTWKVYSIGSFDVANATLVGLCIQDTSNCVATRSFESFTNFLTTNTFVIDGTSSEAYTRDPNCEVSVWGNAIKSGQSIINWEMAVDLDTGLTEASDTYYYFYITENGDTVISDERPYDRRGDLKGHYHPHHSWRCVGFAYNNSSSNLLYHQGLSELSKGKMHNFTPTGGWTTNVSYDGFWWAISPYEVKLRMIVSCGNTPNSAALNIDIPSFLERDTSLDAIFAVKSYHNPYGEVSIYDSSSSFPYRGVAAYFPGNKIGLTVLDVTTASYAIATNVDETTPITFGSGDLVEVICTIHVKKLWWY